MVIVVATGAHFHPDSLGETTGQVVEWFSLCRNESRASPSRESSGQRVGPHYALMGCGLTLLFFCLPCITPIHVLQARLKDELRVCSQTLQGRAASG